MRIFHQLVFDDAVEGTTAYYTGAELNSLLGSADKLMIAYVATGTSGTGPTLSIWVETGPENGALYWASAGTAEVNAQSLSTSQATYGNGYFFGSSTLNSGFVRLKIQLGGTSPKTRLRIWVTGRGGE